MSLALVPQEPKFLGKKTVRVMWNDVENFCRLVGEKNPIHHERQAALDARFQDIVVPGVMTTSFVSGFIAEEFPLAILGEISVRFSEPMYPGEYLTISLSLIASVDKLRKRFITVGFKAVVDLPIAGSKKEIMTGEAKIVLVL